MSRPKRKEIKFTKDSVLTLMQETYNEIVPYDETGKYKGVKCPHCGSKSKIKLISNINFNFSNPVGTDRWCSESQGHDYRFHHNLPNVKKEVENAKKKSHVGANPYNHIDDVSTGKYFGKVK